MKTPAQLHIPQAFAFTPPARKQGTFGPWVVHYLRNKATHASRDYAIFKRKADAVAFFEANKGN